MSVEKNPSWLIHVGCIKCGSTWMQRRLFPALQDVDFVGKRYVADEWGKPIWNGIVHDSEFSFDARKYAALLEAQASCLRNSFHIISSESLAGQPYDGPPDVVRSADRIKAIFPEAKILMVIRKQACFFESMYKQFLLNGGMLSFEKFRRSNTRHCRFDYEFMEFHRLAEYYIRLFGRENVCLLPFELLLKDHQAFADEVTTFLGCRKVTLTSSDKESVRKGFTPVFCRMVHRLNYFRKSGYCPMGIYGFPAISESFAGRFLSPYGWARGLAALIEKFTGPGELFTEEEKREFAMRYQESNRRLCELFPIFQEYGYDKVAVSR